MRELDKQIAELMGQTDFAHPGFFWAEGSTEDGKDGWDGFYCPRCGATEADKAQPCVKRYSSDIAAAWLVHLRMCEQPFSIRRRYLDSIQEQARLSTGALTAWPDVLVVLRGTFAEAICLAARAALGAGGETGG